MQFDIIILFSQEESKEKQYKAWLKERYSDAVDRLVENLLHRHADIQVCSNDEKNVLCHKMVVETSK